jgi:hypothetical protein
MVPEGDGLVFASPLIWRTLLILRLRQTCQKCQKNKTVATIWTHRAGKEGNFYPVFSPVDFGPVWEGAPVPEPYPILPLPLTGVPRIMWS